MEKHPPRRPPRKLLGRVMTYDLAGKTIIVVGGAGYIGSHVCKAIANNNGTPVTFDNFSSGHQHAVKWGPVETVDLRDKAATLTAFEKHKTAHAVVHLASSIEVGIGEKEPAEFYENNVVGAMNLLEAMRTLSITNLIFSSTCATYGETDQMPLLESQIQNPNQTRYRAYDSELSQGLRPFLYNASLFQCLGGRCLRRDWRGT